MKKAKEKKCRAKGCTNTFLQRNSFEVVCSVKCAVSEAKRKEEAKAKKQISLQKQLDKLKLNALKQSVKTRSQWLHEAQVVFNRWIRKRDEFKPCISCGKPLRKGNVDAGHYYSSGAHSSLRFNENNVHSQCSRPCNKDRSGDLINYRVGLLQRIGEAKLNELEVLSKVQKKWEIDELKEIIRKYKL